MNKASVRIDKWLWAARFFKTRTLATEMVGAGHIQCNGNRIKPSQKVQTGDMLHIQRGQETFIIQVMQLAEKRGSATVAQTLYQETEASIHVREDQQRLRKLHAPPAPPKRPDKKSRRQIIRFQRREG